MSKEEERRWLHPPPHHPPFAWFWSIACFRTKKENTFQSILSRFTSSLIFQQIKIHTFTFNYLTKVRLSSHHELKKARIMFSNVTTVTLFLTRFIYLRKHKKKPQNKEDGGNYTYSENYRKCQKSQKNAKNHRKCQKSPKIPKVT